MAVVAEAAADTLVWCAFASVLIRNGVTKTVACGEMIDRWAGELSELMIAFVVCVWNACLVGDGNRSSPTNRMTLVFGNVSVSFPPLTPSPLPLPLPLALWLLLLLSLLFSLFVWLLFRRSLPLWLLINTQLLLVLLISFMFLLKFMFAFAADAGVTIMFCFSANDIWTGCVAPPDLSPSLLPVAPWCKLFDDDVCMDVSDRVSVAADEREENMNVIHYWTGVRVFWFDLPVLSVDVLL